MAQTPGSARQPIQDPFLQDMLLAEQQAAEMKDAAARREQEAPVAPEAVAGMAERAGLIRQRAQELASSDPDREGMIRREDQPGQLRPDIAERQLGIVTSDHVITALQELIAREYISLLPEQERQAVWDGAQPDALRPFILPMLQTWQHLALPRVRNKGERPTQTPSQQLLAGHADAMMHSIRRDQADLHAADLAHHVDLLNRARYNRTNRIIQKVIYGWGN